MELNLNNPIAERKTKTVYRDNDKTIKLFIENYSKADILNEALNQARVEEGTDLSIPKLLEVVKIDNRWAIVSEHVEGITLEQLMNQHPEKMDEYLDKFVGVQMEVLEHRVPMLNRIKEKYTRKISEAPNISENTKYDLLQRLNAMKNHTKLCHGDFNPSNIIVRPDGSYAIIDWAHVTQGNASADCAKTYLILSMDGKVELADKYLKVFCEKTGTKMTNVQRWIPIVAAAQMAKATGDEIEFLHRWIDVVEYQ